MIGKRVLFDTNIIIYASKGELPFSYFDQFAELNVSVITYMEIFGYQFRDIAEQRFMQELFGLFKLLYINIQIADKVIEIRKKKRIKLPDAIIAATAITNDLILASRNIDDYKNVEVNISNPFEK